MLTAKEWKSKTFVAGHSRSGPLEAVDDALEAYTKNQSAVALNALCAAIERWSGSKEPPALPPSGGSLDAQWSTSATSVATGAGTGGYTALLKSSRNRKGAVQELVTDVRKLAGKPATWPDAGQGSSYVVTLDDQTVNLLKQARGEATKRSIAMIAAMDVDWASFGFDQLDAASSTAINLGHTNYVAGWAGAQNNQTSAGQTESTAAAKIFNVVLAKSAETAGADERVENVLRAAGLSINVVLGVLKFHLFKDGVMATAVPYLGPLKESVDAIAKGAVDLRLATKGFERVAAARSLIDRTSDAGTALTSFESLLKIETAKTAINLAYRLLKDTALVVTEALTLGAMTVVQVVTSLVEVVVGFIYQLVYCLVFRKSVSKCREWVAGGSNPDDLDFRSWIAGCPLLGAHFIVGLSAGGGAVTALSMFGQTGQLSSTDFQAASVKLLRVRQAAAAYVQQSPVKVKFTGPNGERFKWIDGLVKSDALSASVGVNSMKIHHWTLSDDADRATRLKHKFHEHGNSIWSLAKTAWSVV